MKEKNKLTAGQADKIVEKVKAGYSSAWEYTESSYHQNWENCWKLYNNQRIKVDYEGISDAFVPMTFSTIETMVSAIAGGRPKFDFVPVKEEQEQDTKVLNALLNYYWECGNWSGVVVNWIRNVLMYGTGVVYAYWDINKPVLINVPLRDFFIDPQASSPKDAKFIGRRFLTTKEELKSYKTVDPDTGKMMPMYTNLNKISSESMTGDNTDKQEKDMWMGSTLGESASAKQIECIEYWDTEKDMVYVVANRSTLIRSSENPYLIQAKEKGKEYAKGLVPFITQRDYVDEALFYGKGEIEPIMSEQEQLNDLNNQLTDSITYTLNQMYTLDPKHSDWIDKVENLPGAVYPFEAGALQPVQKGLVPTAAFNQVSTIKQEIRETTAASEVAKGVDQSVSNVTATQVQAQQQSAGQRFGVKLAQFESEGFHDLGVLIFKMIQLFVTTKTKVRVADEEGVQWKEYDPKKYEGEYEPKVQLASTVKEIKMAEDKRQDSIFETMVSNPLINQSELTKMYLMKRFDLDPVEVDKLTTLPGQEEGAPGEMPGMEGAMGAPMGAGAPAEGGAQGAPGGMQIKGSDFVRLYDLAQGQPDLQAQILAMFGLEPSAYPDLPVTQAIVQVEKDWLDRATQIQQQEIQNEQQLAMNPQAPTPEGMLGVGAQGGEVGTAPGEPPIVENPEAGMQEQANSQEPELIK